MKEIMGQLVGQLQAAMEGPAWHGPSVREALDGVTASEAVEHPIVAAHSIWELVVHLSGSYRLVLRRLEGDDSPFQPLEDWPPLPTQSAENWERDVATLLSLNRAMRAAVTNYATARLLDPIISDPPYSAFTQFIGLTQHDLYHAGQIVLLRRALGTKGSP